MSPGRTIVVYADDDELVRETIAAGLSLEGWRVETCANGAEAISLCEELQPAAVLLDLDMPDLDGYEAATRLRTGAACHPARIVALTGRAVDGVSSKALSSGFDAILFKPVSMAVLSEALASSAQG
jgi:CheY-like chemotaxis protein